MKNIKGNVIFESQRGLTCRVTITRSEMSERGLASLNFIHCMRLSQALYEEIIIHLNLTRRDLSPINGLRYNFTLLFLISLKVLAPKFTSFISSSYFLVFLDQFCTDFQVLLSEMASSKRKVLITGCSDGGLGTSFMELRRH